MDRSAAKAARGVIEERLLYEQPFTDIHALGLDGVFPTLADKLLALIRRLNQGGLLP